MPTSVGVAALEPGSPLPLPGAFSDFAHTDRSEVLFEPGATTGTFKVLTEHVPLGTTQAVVIEASATTTIRTSLLITP